MDSRRHLAMALTDAIGMAIGGCYFLVRVECSPPSGQWRNGARAGLDRLAVGDIAESPTPTASVEP